MTQQETDAIIGRAIREERDERLKGETFRCSIQQVVSDLVELIQKLKSAPQDVETVSFDKQALESLLAEYRQSRTRLAELDVQLRSLGIRPEMKVIG